jgi:predicted RNase H-like HicB family nuclease
MHISYRSPVPNIPYCVAFGQTADTAALAIKDGAGLREVDYRALQDSLIKQGVPLPGVYSAL